MRSQGGPLVHLATRRVLRPGLNGTFIGDYAGIAVTARTVYPIWSDTRPVDQFLCPGTGTPSSPPAVCEGGAANASIANDQDAYATGTPLR